VSVNEGTDFESAPEVRCGTVFDALITIIWCMTQFESILRVDMALSDWILKGLLPHVDMYILERCTIRLQYHYQGLSYMPWLAHDVSLSHGWVRNPGWWELVGQAIVWPLQQDGPGGGRLDIEGAEATC
jgi:hypothetical protein